MTIPALLSRLFDLGRQTDFLNSSHAAWDFWGLVAIAALVAIAIAVVQANRPHAPRPH
jgi:hypothetical protein